MEKGEREFVEQSNELHGRLTQKQILAAYESGPEAVLALFVRLQAGEVRVEQTVPELGIGIQPAETDRNLFQPIQDESDEFANDIEDVPPSVADFDKFMAALAPDRDQAAKRYQRIWQSLIRYFIRRKESDPEACADQVLEVLQRKIAKGETIREIEQYSFAVARKIRLKEWSRRRRLVDLPEGLEGRNEPSLLETAEKRAVSKCMVACIQALPSDKRKQIISYYLGKAHDKERREALAEEFGISLNTLKVRVHRLADSLKVCLNQCLNKCDRNV